MAADRGPSGGRLGNGGGALHDATACAPTGSGAAEGLSQLPMGVPPVGVEPTLGTLLGGRPLPLGYGGWVMIPRLVRTILAQANRGRKIHPSAQIQFTALRHRMRSVTNLPNFCIHRALSVAACRAGRLGREPAAVPLAHLPPVPTTGHYSPFTFTAPPPHAAAPPSASLLLGIGPAGSGPVPSGNGSRRCVYCVTALLRGRAWIPAAVRARWKTASSMGGVTRPVKVFCWLGW